MANEFTSVTTAGLGTNLVKAAYDLYLNNALDAMPMIRQFVSVRPQHPAHPGSSVTMNKFNPFSEASVTAAKTPLTEESDVDSTKVPATTPVVFTPNEYGFAVTKTKLLGNRTFVGFDDKIANAVSVHCAKTIDELIQDKIKAGITATTSDGGAENALTNADKLTAAHLRKVVTTFRRNNVDGYEGQWFVGVLHPDVIHDLRTETGPGAWRTPKEYVDPGQLYAGEITEFEGVRIVSNNRVRKGAGAASAVSYNSYFFGANGLGEHVVEEPNIVQGPTVDKLGRFATVGWYADLGWAVYEPLAIQDVISSSSLSA